MLRNQMVLLFSFSNTLIWTKTVINTLTAKYFKLLKPKEYAHIKIKLLKSDKLK